MEKSSPLTENCTARKQLHEKQEKIMAIIVPDNHKYIEKLTDSLNEKGVEVVLLSPFHYATPLNFLKTFILKLQGFNVIHIQWVYVFPFDWLMKLYVTLAKKLGYKIAYTLHDVHESALQGRFTSRKKVVWMYNNVDYSFIHYKSNLKLLEKQLGVKPHNIETIYHPIFEGYADQVTKKEARESLGIPLDKKVVLLFGKLARYKGVEYFADALQHLDESYYGLMVGREWDSELIEEIKVRSIPNLRVIDKYIPDEEVQYYLNACDVVVAPYTSITTSGVVLLAYSFSRPVIATRLGGVPEVVEHEETGLLIPPEDVEALIDAIKKLFIMDYEAMGRKAYELAKEKFTWEKLAEQTMNVYRKVVENE
ncbi:MAG: glycosyltransferase family 4 protein [Thermoplasmatota archaeon]